MPASVSKRWGSVSSGYQIDSSIETVTTGACSLYKRVTLLSVDGTKALTLASGTVIGQRKTFICTVAANTPAGTLTPTNLIGGTTIYFDAVGETAELVWTGAKWGIVAVNGATIA